MGLGQMGSHVPLDGGLGLVPLTTVVATKGAFLRVRAHVGQQQAFVLACVATHVALMEGTVLGLVVPLHGTDFGEDSSASSTRALFLQCLSVVMQSLVHLHKVASQPFQRAAFAPKRGHQGVLASHVSCHAGQGSLHSAAQLAPALDPPSPPSANTIRATPQILLRSTIIQRHSTI
jgi:hypothetical protein